MSKSALLCFGCSLLLALTYGCGPSPESLAKRLDSQSPTYDEDRQALIELGKEAIDPCINRAVSEQSEPLARSVVGAMMMGDVLKEIDPAGAMSEIERRYDTADLTTRQTLWSLATSIGRPHNKEFILRQLDSLAIENVVQAVSALGAYTDDKEMRAVLDRSLVSTNRLIRLCAAMALFEVDIKSIAVLEAAVADEGMPLPMRMQLVAILETSRFHEGRAALRRLKTVKNREVREWVLRALERPPIQRR